YRNVTEVQTCALPIYYTFALFLRLSAGVVKLVDTLDLGSNAERLGGSSPFTRTFFANPRFQMLTIKEVSLAHPPAQQPAFLTATRHWNYYCPITFIIKF